MINFIIMIIILKNGFLIIVVKRFLAHDALGVCRAICVSPEQPGWRDCKRTVDVSEMTVVSVVCQGHPSHALIDPALLTFLVSDSCISAINSPRPRLIFWERMVSDL